MFNWKSMLFFTYKIKIKIKIKIKMVFHVSYQTAGIL